MSTDKQAVDEPVEEPADEPVSEPVADEPAADKGDGGEDVGDARHPSWWHRDHPTFAALSGFFTGLLFVALVPAAFYGVLSLWSTTIAPRICSRSCWSPSSSRSGWSPASAPAGSAPT